LPRSGRRWLMLRHKQTADSGGGAVSLTIFPPPYHLYTPVPVRRAQCRRPSFSQSIIFIFSHDARSETPKLPFYYAQSPPPLSSTEPFCTRRRPSNSHSRLALSLDPKAFFNQATTTTTTTSTTSLNNNSRGPIVHPRASLLGPTIAPLGLRLQNHSKATPRLPRRPKVHAWAVTR
jgi:hypothetical protein